MTAPKYGYGCFHTRAGVPDPWDNEEDPEESGWEDLPPTISAQKLADLVGVSIKTLYEAIQDGNIPGVSRVGRKYIIATAVVREHFTGK